MVISRPLMETVRRESLVSATGRPPRCLTSLGEGAEAWSSIRFREAMVWVTA
jgi:hypothetical protein